MFHIVLIFSVFHKCHGNTTQHACHYICHNLCNITIVCVGVMTRNLPTTTQYNSFCHKVINCFYHQSKMMSINTCLHSKQFTLF